MFSLSVIQVVKPHRPSNLDAKSSVLARPRQFSLRCSSSPGRSESRGPGLLPTFGQERWLEGGSLCPLKWSQERKPASIGVEGDHLKTLRDNSTDSCWIPDDSDHGLSPFFAPKKALTWQACSLPRMAPSSLLSGPPPVGRRGRNPFDLTCVENYQQILCSPSAWRDRIFGRRGSKPGARPCSERPGRGRYIFSSWTVDTYQDPRYPAQLLTMRPDWRPLVGQARSGPAIWTGGRGATEADGGSLLKEMSQDPRTRGLDLRISLSRCLA